MLEDLLSIHQQVIGDTPTDIQRYLYDGINWDAQAICIVGGRGVGKTTLMCQAIIQRYTSAQEALYLSADNIHVLSLGLFSIAQQFFAHGGKALFIDEVHKYPEWATEIKNIIDTYKSKKIVFSASSSIDLTASKTDLSRRVVYYSLKGLSFREYLQFENIAKLEPLTLNQLLQNHVEIASGFKQHSILKHFHDYLRIGYFPFYLEGKSDYIVKVNNVIEKAIYEDIAVMHNLRQTSVVLLKKLLWLIATSTILQPNIDKISKDLRSSRENIYDCIDYLGRAGLINNVYPKATGAKLVRKPSKIYLENTNLLYSIHNNLKLATEKGNIRETFIVNQLSDLTRLNTHDSADFIIDDDIVIEVGGKSKNKRQIKHETNGYIAADDIEIGFANKIPLYLFGLMY
tara:strand:+ start:16400 stop:17602 length:1203 start_codon:yes stop_codon:yes gene_type:complete